MLWHVATLIRLSTTARRQLQITGEDGEEVDDVVRVGHKLAHASVCGYAIQPWPPRLR